MKRKTLAVGSVIFFGAITANADELSRIHVSAPGFHALNYSLDDLTEPADDASGGASGEAEPQVAARRPSTFHRVLEDQKEIYIAPFRRRNFKWDLLIVAATGGLIAGDKHISGALSRDHTEISSHISEIGLYSMSASVAGLWLSHFKSNDSHARETGILAAEAVASTAGVYAMTQLIAGRERPTEGSANGRFFQHNALGSSFPSGHSSFTWAMAAVVAHEYPKPWVRCLAYGTATTVSLARTRSLKHFSSDVAVGGVFGYLIGRHMFHVHCAQGLSSVCRSGHG